MLGGRANTPKTSLLRLKRAGSRLILLDCGFPPMLRWGLARKILALEKLAMILRWRASAQTAPMRFWRHWLMLPLTAAGS